MRPVAFRVLFTACILAGSLGVFAASAQERLTANVPFSFRAGVTVTPAGNYEISPNFTPGVTMLHNVDTNGWVSIFRQGGISDPQDSRPRLLFRCSSSGCTLSQIFTGANGWQLPTPRLSPAEKERLAVIFLDAGKKSN